MATFARRPNRRDLFLVLGMVAVVAAIALLTTASVLSQTREVIW
jgi:hypothetical protein